MDGAGEHAGRALAIERRLISRLLRAIGFGDLRIVLWDGQEAAPGEPGGRTVCFRNRRAMYRLLMNPSIGFGDGYSTGAIEVDGDLVAFIEHSYRGMNAARRRALPRLMAAFARRAPHNTLEGSKQHIHSHYDLGNAFYKLWLDERMLYTCAYYPTEDATLEEAQLAKMDHVCRKLRLKPGMTVLETGCGWGGLALHMARHYGVTVKAYNISHEQIVHAQQQAMKLALHERAQFIEDDYRNAEGEFDRFVSVGMLEHVGVGNYPALGAVIDRTLKPDGVGLIHTIGRNYPRAMDKWIEKRIFPGACPPSLKQMMDILEPYELSVLDVENIRLHYARTCRDWLNRFENHRDRIAEMFDEHFVRAWRLYLCGSIAAFNTGSLQLFQMVFNRQPNNAIPLTRQYMYERAEAEYAQV